MYGHFPKAHQDALRPFIKGHRIVDLGAGDCERTRVLHRLRPAALLAVDKNFPYEYPTPPSPPFKRLPGAITDVAWDIIAFNPDVAYLAWPVNHRIPGLPEILLNIPVVVYVGSNVDGSSCGTPELFRYFLGREVLLYLPDRRNTLIVYGAHYLGLPRLPAPEEKAALDQQEITCKVSSFDPAPYDSGRQGGVLPG